MTAHILIIVSIAVMPVAHNRSSSSSATHVGSTWSHITTQRFDDRKACEHTARQIRAMQGVGHDVRMTCQPAALEKP